MGNILKSPLKKNEVKNYPISRYPYIRG